MKWKIVKCYLPANNPLIKEDFSPELYLILLIECHNCDNGRKTVNIADEM